MGFHGLSPGHPKSVRTILIGQTFCPIPASYDSTIAETFSEYGIPHYPVVLMGIDANGVIFPEGKLHCNMQNTFPAAIACYAVYGGLRTGIRPFSVGDYIVSGVITGSEYESGDDIFAGLNDIAV